jgi:hypothetical protein
LSKRPAVLVVVVVAARVYQTNTVRLHLVVVVPVRAKGVVVVVGRTTVTTVDPVAMLVRCSSLSTSQPSHVAMLARCSISDGIAHYT